MIIEAQVIVDTIFISKILDGIKITIAITISIQTDITLAIPLGSSFQPNDFIIGLSQNFINKFNVNLLINDVKYGSVNIPMD